MTTNYERHTRTPDRLDSTYLGDGVYASFDGYHIALAVNHHENVVIYLDSSVQDDLVRYIEKIKNREP
jgi:hypothetical protein